MTIDQINLKQKGRIFVQKKVICLSNMTCRKIDELQALEGIYSYTSDHKIAEFRNSKHEIAEKVINQE